MPLWSPGYVRTILDAQVAEVQAEAARPVACWTTWGVGQGRKQRLWHAIRFSLNLKFY